MRARHILWSIAGLGAAGGIALARLYRSLEPDTGEDEVVRADTADGWSLAMRRYRAVGARKGVVVAGHGFAGTGLIWDLHPRFSLARHLASAGFDFYALDLRGRRESWPSTGDPHDVAWSFDDFVWRDLPAAIAAARETSGHDTVFWVGLEMSGQALYAATISGTIEVAGAVTLGAPVWTPPEAMVPGVTAPPRARRHGRIPFRAGARAAGPILALTRARVLESSFVPANVEWIVPARYMRHGIPDESTRLADQFRDWIDHDTMRSLDHQTVWSERLDEVDVPLMMWAAAHDLQRPPDAVRRAYDAMGSTDKVFVDAGRTGGFPVDYGHDDLVAARTSPAAVYPRIVEWMEKRA